MIVHYETRSELDSCLVALAARDPKGTIEVFVVDNASSDFAAAAVTNRIADAVVIQNTDNVGFARAANQALKQARGRYLLLLNPDAIVEPGTLDRMVRYMDERPDVGCATARLVLPDGRLDLACRRSFPTPKRAFYRLTLLSRLFPRSRRFAQYNLTYLDENQETEIDSPCGAFMMVPARVRDEVGLLDENYFMYGEDLDWAFRIKEAGWRVMYTPITTVLHTKTGEQQPVTTAHDSGLLRRDADLLQAPLRGALSEAGQLADVCCHRFARGAGADICPDQQQGCQSLKGLILAGGNGTRLDPLTRVTNKHLLPMYDRPMIFYPIETLSSMGIREVMVVLGGRSVGDIVELLGDGSDFGVDLTYRYQNDAQGIAHAIGLARDFVGSDSFCVVLGDNILRGDPLVETAKAFDEGDWGAGTLLYQVPDPERFGVAEFDGDRLVGFEEKPKVPKSNLIPIGVYFLRPDAFDVIAHLVPSARGEFEITDVLNHYIPDGRLFWHEYDGHWSDAGTIESLLAASELAARASGSQKSAPVSRP